MEWKVALFYQYTTPQDAAAEAAVQREKCASLGLIGRVLVAPEGVNGSLAARSESGGLQAYVEWMCARDDQFAAMSADDFKLSRATDRGVSWRPFPDLFVSVRKELISSGGAFCAIDVDETKRGYLTPVEWDDKVRAASTVVLDVRNEKEYAVGHFRGAVNPATRTFAEWPRYVEKTLDVESLRGKDILMYCTGGIRCEKASAFLRRKLRALGEEESAHRVHHLKGGIHKYLECFPDGGAFAGRNFVFDARGSHAGAHAEVGSAAGSRRGSDGACGASAHVSVVGKCCACAAPHDVYDAALICTVCREPLLVCAACRAPRREFYCAIHADLASCVFTELGAFSAAALGAQRAELEARVARIATGKAKKNRRRVLRKQVGRIDARLADLAASEASAASMTAAPTAAAACRSCKRPRSECSGACWGFHGVARAAILSSSSGGGCGGGRVGLDAARWVFFYVPLHFTRILLTV
jgi:predicted sulfurtransferase